MYLYYVSKLLDRIVRKMSFTPFQHMTGTIVAGPSTEDDTGIIKKLNSTSLRHLQQDQESRALNTAFPLIESIVKKNAKAYSLLFCLFSNNIKIYHHTKY